MRCLTNIPPTTNMIRKQLFHSCLASLSMFGALHAASFTAGNIAVFQAAASTTNTTGSIVELNTTTAGQSPSNTILIDGVTPPNGLRFSGSATSTGYLSRSNDGSLLAFAGHNSTNTSANANTLTARGVGTLNAAGTFALPATYTGASSNQARSATSLNNTNWFIGDQGGLYTNSTTTPSPTANLRGVKSFGGTVYGLQASSTATVIAVSTISATSGGTVTGLPGLTNLSACQDFQLISSGDNGTTYDILYILSATSNTAGTINKYSLVSGNWTANGSYTTTFGGFGLAAADNANGALLYVSTGLGALTANSVLKISDTAGYNATLAITTANNVSLYTAPTGAVVKGVAFAPVNPLPDLTVGVTAPANATTGTNFSYTLTATNAGNTTSSGFPVQLTLPAGLSYVSATGTNGFTGSESSGVVTFSGGTLNANSSATLTVTVSASSASNYTAPVGAAVIDPSNTVAESNESNNSSPAATSTVVVVPNSPPTFTLQPAASTAVAYGATTTLTTTASGNPAPTFQWYSGNSGNTSSPLVGETAASFTTPAITANTSYWVRATNTQGIADSNTAAISVTLSANADLSSLALGSGSLSPAFASGNFSYTAAVASNTTTMTVTPTTSNAQSSIQVRVNGGSYSPVISGNPGGPLALNVGSNTIDVLVTAQNGIATNTYTVTVTRTTPSVLTAGDLMFSAINTDEDGFAMVALRDIPANNTVYFTDNEWDGTAFNTGESYLQWVSGASTIPAGTVIRFLSTDLATLSSSVGTLSRATVTGSSNYGFSQSGETVYAYVADSVTSAPTFLSAIATVSFDATNGLLTNTGLTIGAGALQTGLATGSDFAEYTASRSNQTTFAAYLPLVSNIANWTDGGDGSYATTVPNTTAFTLGSAATSTLAINDVSITEGNSGTATMTFTVTRNNSATALSVDYATADGTATQPGDYTSTLGTLTFTAGGVLSQPVSVTIQGDTISEPDETLFVNLSNVVNSVGTTTISDAQGIGTILNDEPVVTNPLASTSRDVLVPNTDTWPAAGVTVNGTKFVNLGLQGVGRIPANAIDEIASGPGTHTGESLGSISDMQITGFTNNNNGTWSGTFHFLPDRGYNSGSIYSNYAARINDYTFTFTPYTSATPTTNQNQVAMTFTGSTRFTYDHDGNAATAPVYTTGMLSDKVGSLFATSVPVVNGVTVQSDGSVTDRLTVDAEGLVLDTRSGKSGSGWVSDEYGPYIYHFNASKQLDGQLQLPDALLPRTSNAINFAGTPTTGRRDNQGMEGLAQSPNGSKLFGLMQSATIQDSGSGNQGRSNTRLLVYNLSNSDTPNDPAEQYVIQLPRVNSTGNGGPVDRNGAQSSILALNDHQILILSRDGNGRGASGAPVFKSILLADISNASNIDGSFDSATSAVAPGGVLNASVTPISWTEALNLIGKLDLNIAEIAKFGLNLNTAPGDINTLCEKWEALSLVSAHDPAAPNDYFLFVGNDNDFLTATGKYLNASGTLQSYNAGLENDTLILAYRVRFVQPLDAWRIANFGSNAPNSGLTADNADFDADGISNIVEYALGTNPTLATGSNGPAALPHGILGDANSLLTDRLTLGFTLPNPSPSDISFTVQATPDLTTWADLARKSGTVGWSWIDGGTSRVVTSNSGGISNVKVGDKLPMTGNPRRMMRLNVSKY